MQTNQSPEQVAAILKGQIAMLERQVYLQLLVLIVVSGTLTSFFLPTSKQSVQRNSA